MTVIQMPDRNAAAGVVTGVTPSEGSAVRQGSSITLYVSQGGSSASPSPQATKAHEARFRLTNGLLGGLARRADNQLNTVGPAQCRPPQLCSFPVNRTAAPPKPKKRSAHG